jgi:hypothetical protein
LLTAGAYMESYVVQAPMNEHDGFAYGRRLHGILCGPGADECRS